MARRDEGAYCWYVTEEQRSQPGCIGREGLAIRGPLVELRVGTLPSSTLLPGAALLHAPAHGSSADDHRAGTKGGRREPVGLDAVDVATDAHAVGPRGFDR
jgi:hypothetical protein